MSSGRAILRHSGSRDQMAFWGVDPIVDPFKAFVGGIGSGKTRAGAVEVLRQEPGSRGMVVAPTYDMLRNASLETFFEIAEPFIASHNETRLRTVLCNGMVILWRSADKPSRLRGPNLNWFWMDEGAYFKNDETWRVLLGRIRRKGRRGGWCTTSPNGYNWMYDVFGKEERAGFSLIQASTLDSPFLPEEYKRNLIANYSSEFAQQEIYGQFISMGDKRIRRYWLSEASPILSQCQILMGVDLAISEQEAGPKKTGAKGGTADPDYTAIVVVARHNQTGMRYVLDAQRDRLSFHKVLQFIGKMARTYHPSQINIESNQFQAAVVQELLRTTNLPVKGKFSETDKLTRFLPVEARYEHGLVKHVPGLNTEFVDELLGFQGAPHDDFVDALGLACDFGDLPYIAKAGPARQHNPDHLIRR